MKQALISPQETVGLPAGHARVAQVADEAFPLAEPLFWVECPDDIQADQHSYNIVAATFHQVHPTQEPGAMQVQPTTQGMETL